MFGSCVLEIRYPNKSLHRCWCFCEIDKEKQQWYKPHDYYYYSFKFSLICRVFATIFWTVANRSQQSLANDDEQKPDLFLQ